MNIQSITPNLLVADVNQAADFYQQYLHALVLASVPESGQLDFVMMQMGEAVLMLQSLESMAREHPSFTGREIGGTFTLFAKLAGVRDYRARLEGQVRIVDDLHETFYGTFEFTFIAPDGYFWTLAEDLAQE